MLRLCALFLMVAHVISAAIDCSGGLTLSQSVVLCNSSKGGGRITHTAVNATIDCDGAYLKEYTATMASDITMSRCRSDAPAFGGAPAKAVIRDCILNGTAFYSGATVYFEKTNLKYVAFSGSAEGNITFGPGSSAGTIAGILGARLSIDYAGTETTRLLINTVGPCAVRRFPPGSVMCAIAGNCTYLGRNFTGCITTPNGTLPVSKSGSGTPSISTSHKNTVSARTSTTESQTGSAHHTPTEDRSGSMHHTQTEAEWTSTILTSPTVSLDSSRSLRDSGTHSLTTSPYDSATPAIEISIPLPAGSPVSVAATPTLPRAAETTALVAGTTAAALSPASASGAARVGAIGLMIRCEQNSDDVPTYWDFPLQDYVHRSFPLTLLIAAGTNLLLQTTVAFCYAKKHVNLAVKWVPALMLGYQAPAFATAAAAHAGESSTVWAAVGLMTLALGYPTIMALTRPETRADFVAGGTRKVGGQEIPSTALYGQFEDLEGGVYCELFGEYVGPLRSHSSLAVRAGLVAEIWLGVVCGVFTGLRGGGACVAYSFAMLGLSVCFCIYQMSVSPLAPWFERRSAQGKALAMVGLSALGCAAMAVESLEAWVGWISAVLFVYMPVEIAVGIVLDWRAHKERKKYLVDGSCGSPLLAVPKITTNPSPSPTPAERAPIVRVNPLL
jgi:hypothetical protein